MLTIAHYLPQFSPCTDNDEFWGKGFTEWHNVAAGRPLFEGHTQPNLPGELGFYDLRVPATRSAQWTLARDYGIDAFCMWYYWFGGGRRVFEERVDEMAEVRFSDQTYALGWANESWTGAWHGLDGRTLIQQRYDEDPQGHYDYLVRHFLRPNYLKLNIGRPLLYLYRPDQLRQLDLWVEGLRSTCRESGILAPYIVGEAAGAWYLDPESPLDAYTWNPPPPIPNDALFAEFGSEAVLSEPWVYDFSDPYFDWISNGRPDSQLRSHQAVICGFDNTPRTSTAGVVLSGVDRHRLTIFARRAFQLEAAKEGPHMVFIKSWNEWAEGSVLEPTWLGGRALLEAIRDARNNVGS